MSDGAVEYVERDGDYGVQVCIRLGVMSGSEIDRVAATLHATALFAFYARLSWVFVGAGHINHEGQVIALSGNSGNAQHTPPHLHFEIRTESWPGRGLGGRLDPGEVLGFQHYGCEV